MAADEASSSSSSFPPPPPPLLLSPLPLAVVPDRLPPSASLSFTPSLHIIAAIIACVFLACAFIHLVLRFLSSSASSRRPSLPSSVSTASLLLRFRTTPGVAVTSSAAAPPSSVDKVKSALIDSLPVFTLASSLAALPKSSPDCAVCLRPFRPDENLRLLPACRHAFHSGCVEPWIRNTPSCPLCRARVTLPAPPLPSQGMLPAGGDDSSGTGSVCVEICSDGRAEDESRRIPSPPAPPESPPRRRPSSSDHTTEEEGEETPAERNPRREGAISAGSAAGPPAEEVGGIPDGGGSRKWLRDYTDRVAWSASSSFRRSGRWIQHYEDGERNWADLEMEGSARPESTTTDDDGGLTALYRWIVGV